MTEKRDKYLHKLTITLIDELRLLEFRSIFEVGCAYGRLTKILNHKFPHASITALDLSREQIENANKYSCNANVHFIVGKFQDYEPLRTYDLVVSFSFLMHIAPTDIESVIKKMLDMANCYMVHVDWYRKKPCQKEYCFAHNYHEIYEKNGFKPKVLLVNPHRLGVGEKEAIWIVKK